MKDNKRIYTLQELDDLLKKEHTCIILKQCNRKIELKAKYVKDLKAGIQEALDKGLNKFDYSLNGILLDYRNLNILVDECNGRIVGRCGEFLITIKAEFFVFDPKIGNLLEGEVNAKSDSHVGCLVHKRFNAMLLKSDIESKWKCENIQIGENIIFTIVDHVFSGRIPHIEGCYYASTKKSLEKKSKSKVLNTKVEEFKENGEINNEFVKITEGNTTKKNKLGKVDLSKLNFKGIEEPGSMDNLQKSKSKKKKNVATNTSVGNVMDLGEPVIEVKKKKNNKEKDNENDNILETEKTFESLNVSSTHTETPASVFSAKATTVKDDENIKRKKKEGKKNVQHSDESKKRSKKDEDVGSTESSSHKKKKKKHDNEKCSQTVEAPVQKSKKKRKRDGENSTGHIVETGENSEISLPEGNKLPVDDKTEVNVSHVHFIDELMNIVPSEVILRSEATPVKGNSPENLTSPKRVKLGEDNKKTPEKSSPPSKKKRGESGMENTLQNTRLDDLEDSPSKKRLLEQSMMSKSNNLQEESLFSDVEATMASSLRSPKSLTNPLILAGSSQRKRGIDEADNDKLPSSSTFKKAKNAHPKERKPGKIKAQSEKKKLKNESHSLQVAESDDNIIKSPVNKKEKKGLDTEKYTLGNKSVARNSGSIISPVEESQTTLLQRFESCLKKEEAKPIGTSSSKTADTAIQDGKTDETSKDLSKEKSKKRKVDNNKKSESKEEANKSTGSFGDSAQLVSFLSGVDTTQLNNPVTTSTPKGNTSENHAGKSRKRNTKKPSGDLKDDERTSIINSLMVQTMESIGLGSKTDFSPQQKKEAVQSTLSKWLVDNKDKKASKKED